MFANSVDCGSERTFRPFNHLLKNGVHLTLIFSGSPGGDSVAHWAREKIPRVARGETRHGKDILRWAFIAEELECHTGKQAS